jgi:hypothetical protein
LSREIVGNVSSPLFGVPAGAPSVGVPAYWVLGIGTEVTPDECGPVPAVAVDLVILG